MCLLYNSKLKKKIIVLASGSGSSFQALCKFFKNSEDLEISFLICNNKTAPALKKATKEKVKTMIIDKTIFESAEFLTKLLKLNVNLIVLAGFLWKVPQKIVESFKNKIINIHPSLLPKYGGKGMYGINVHQEVIKNNEKLSGFTIHYVNEEYDEGDIIFQKPLKIETTNPNELSKQILKLEHKHYPLIIKKILDDQS